MAATLSITGPQTPAAGEMFCALCAALYKGDALKRLSSQIEESKKQPASRVVRMALPASDVQLQAAVAFGMVQLPMAGQLLPTLAPLCWTHLYALQTTDGVIPATAMPSGPVLLGGGR